MQRKYISFKNVQSFFFPIADGTAKLLGSEIRELAQRPDELGDQKRKTTLKPVPSFGRLKEISSSS